MFEKVCRQYLIRMNRKDKLETPFFKIGKYYYDDPKHKRMVNSAFKYIYILHF